MSAILKTGLLGGILLAVFYDLAERFHFPTFPIHIVLIPGGMMLAINSFLKPLTNRAKYNYIVGICKLKKSHRTVNHIWFLPTLNHKAENQKSLPFPNPRKYNE